jgi:hypothetical protein
MGQWLLGSKARVLIKIRIRAKAEAQKLGEAQKQGSKQILKIVKKKNNKKK